MASFGVIIGLFIGGTAQDENRHRRSCPPDKADVSPIRQSQHILLDPATRQTRGSIHVFSLWSPPFPHASRHFPTLAGLLVLLHTRMPLWACDFESCHRPAVRTFGDCVLCNRHLCSNHLEPKFHTCPRWEVSMLPRSAYLLANSSIVRTRTLTILWPGMPKDVSSQN
jgi:hypothetical protein